MGEVGKPGQTPAILTYRSDLGLHHSWSDLFCKGYEYKWNLLHVNAVLAVGSAALPSSMRVSSYADIFRTKNKLCDVVPLIFSALYTNVVSSN